MDRGGFIPLYLQGSSRSMPKENPLVRSSKDVDETGSCGKRLRMGEETVGAPPSLDCIVIPRNADCSCTVNSRCTDT